MTATVVMDRTGMDRAEALSAEQFDEFYRSTKGTLRSYIWRVAADEALADDILQESYIRLLNAPPMEQGKRKAYLYRIATNLIMDHRRDKGRWQRWWKRFERVVQPFDPRLDLVSDMRHLFTQISVRERALLWLAYVEGADHQEIAEALNVRPKSVKVLLCRARQKMEAILREHGFQANR